jgi:hypothetical protein
VNCNAHKPQILKGLPADQASNPVGCGGPIRTVYTIIEHTVPQRIDSFPCLTLLFASVRSVKTAPFGDCLGKSSFNPRELASDT